MGKPGSSGSITARKNIIITWSALNARELWKCLTASRLRSKNTSPAATGSKPSPTNWSFSEFARLARCLEAPGETLAKAGSSWDIQPVAHINFVGNFVGNFVDAAIRQLCGYQSCSTTRWFVPKVPFQHRFQGLT